MIALLKQAEMYDIKVKEENKSPLPLLEKGLMGSIPLNDSSECPAQQYIKGFEPS